MITNNNKIHVEHLKKNFGTLEVLKDINLDISEGEVVVIIGPSGSGKSTFLRCLNRLENLTEGTVIINGKNISDKRININEARENIGMVFQHFNLFPNMSVLENISLAPVELKKASKEQAHIEAMKLLQRVGLESKANVRPQQLSGGQKQRVAIARALAKSGMTMICVTHEMGFAREVADRIIFMADGYIVEQGTPEEVLKHPKQERTINFLKKVL